MEVFRFKRELPDIGPETIFEIGGIPVANTTLTILLIIVLFVFSAFFVIRRFQLRPGRGQNIIEVIYESITGLIRQIAGSDELAQKIFPLVGTIFVYIGISNLIGLTPGLTSITYKDQAVFRTPTNDFNTTFSLALAMVILIQGAAIKKIGIFAYLGRFFQFKKVFLAFRAGFRKGGFAIIEFLIGLLDIISEFAKIVSLSLRLFGNMYAGEALAILILGAIAYVLPAAWLTMNLLVAVVQATVFGSLVAAYYGLAVQTEESGNN